MKYIEKKYQQLIEDMERAYDGACDTLKYHINELQKIIAEKDEEIEKLRDGDKLQNEIDEYNRFEAQHNMNLEDENTQLKAKLSEKENDLKEAYGTIEAWETRFYTLAKAYGIDLNKPVKASAVVHHCGGEERAKAVKPKTRKSKIKVLNCVDCKKYFNAKSRNAKRCAGCRRKHINELNKKYQANKK